MGWSVNTTDIDNAYVQSDQETPVAITVPPEFKRFGYTDEEVLYLEKALYGLRGSGGCFNRLLERCLRSLGFVQSYLDPCLWRTPDTGEDPFFVAYHVDDLITFGPAGRHKKFLDALGEHLLLTDAGEASDHIGLQFKWSGEGEKRECVLHQEQYIAKMLAEHNMTTCKPAATPIPPGQILDDGSPTVEHATIQPRRFVGILNWLCLSRIGQPPLPRSVKPPIEGLDIAHSSRLDVLGRRWPSSSRERQQACAG